MTDIRAQTASSISGQHQLKAIQHWLFSVCFLIFCMVVVGGVTRLTDSGLSITEWKPLLGAIPPLNEEHWQIEFEKYRQIPEYQLQNKGMSLAEFQFIYWWEWGHRFLGRFIGIVFAVPFLWFTWRRQIPRPLYLPLLGLLFLGGLQGFVGWWMVYSGLSERVDVSQYRLATHLTLALIIFALTFWLALSVRNAANSRGGQSVGIFTFFSAWALVLLLFVHFFGGALVAGLDAGLIYNTWPLMDGVFIPGDLLQNAPGGLINIFEDIQTVQFNHRMLAYGLLLLASCHVWWVLKSEEGVVRSTALAMFAALIIQAVIGIVTLLLVVPLWAGALHQGFAVVVLALVMLHVHNMAYPVASD